MKLSQVLLSSLLVTLAGCSEKVVPKTEIPEDNTNENPETVQPGPVKPPKPKETPSDSVQAIPKGKPEHGYDYCPPCGRG